MMKDVYTRKEVIDITNNYVSQIAKLKKEMDEDKMYNYNQLVKLRKQLDDNAKKFAKLMYESINLAWQQIDEDNEELDSCS